MKSFLRNNKGFLKGYILGIVMFIGIAVYQAYTAIEITYTPSDTSWNVSDVKSALDDLYIKANTYSVVGISNNINYGTVTALNTITKGGTTTLTITPNTNSSQTIYLSDFSCDNGYTYSGVSTGSSYTSSQTATISNNNQTSNTTCTATFAVAGCYVNKSGSNGWNAKYYCSNGTGEMRECWYYGTKCGNGSYGGGHWSYLCTYGTNGTGAPYQFCSTSINSDVRANGGGMSFTIDDCTC